MIKQKTGWTFSVHPEEVNKILTWEEKHIKKNIMGMVMQMLLTAASLMSLLLLLLVILV